MSWVLPSALMVAGMAVALTIAVHFIARSRPLAEPLPTARFIPERAIRARTRSLALSDVLLLLLRALALAALGAAVAGPLFSLAHRSTARVIVADRTSAVANRGEVDDSVRTLARPGDVMIPLNGAVRGSMSAALAAAIHAGASLSTRSDSVELILVSPFAREEIDAATLRLRDAWPGRARLVQVHAAGAPPGESRAQARGDPNDAVVAGLTLAGLTADSSNVRVERNRLTGDDSAWAREAGHALVHWPSSPEATNWPLRPSIDAIGGVASPSGTLVGRFPRPWILSGLAVARWADGEVAAAERTTGGGCIRDVALLVDEASDLTLWPAFGDFARALLAPCGGVTTLSRPDTASLSFLAGKGALASASVLRDQTAVSSRWTPWLLAIAALLLILELALRRGARRPTT